MKSSFVLFLFLAAGLFGVSCKNNSPTDPEVPVPPWEIGQLAEAVLGQSNFTSSAVLALGQNSVNKPYGLAISATGTLFVVDQLDAHRILRFDNANTKANGSNADGVLGQPDFTTETWNYGLGGSAPSSRGLESPISITLDASGNLYVADQANGRVLRFNNAASKANGDSADAVLGRPDFTSKGFGTTQNEFYVPQAVAVDASGNLYVADGSNNRVLRFSNAAAKANGANADGVLGQSTYTTGSTGAGANQMSNPSSLAVDKNGHLYVGDRGNSRVLIFLNAAAKANGAAADLVLGKSAFGDGSTPPSATSTSIHTPYALAVDGNNNLYVADGLFNRVLVFYNAPSKSNGASADAVLGKKDFTSSAVTAAAADNVGQPFGLAVHSATGKLYVSCYSNARILRFQSKSALSP
ncbi:MAG: NHL repeat-containing protein [Bacteroidota bacterium]